jgi:hypothetical protein
MHHRAYSRAEPINRARTLNGSKTQFCTYTSRCPPLPGNPPPSPTTNSTYHASRRRCARFSRLLLLLYSRTVCDIQLPRAACSRRAAVLPPRCRPEAPLSLSLLCSTTRLDSHGLECETERCFNSKGHGAQTSDRSSLAHREGPGYLAFTSLLFLLLPSSSLPNGSTWTH